MFVPDNIQQNESIKILENQLGGITKLQNDLKTDIKKGISTRNQQELNQRIKYFGKNEYLRRPPKKMIELIIECFEDLMLQILVGASIVSTIVGIIDEGIVKGWIEGFTIILAICIIVSISAGNNYMKELQFQKLTEKKDDIKVHVRRNEQTIYLNPNKILVGDILNLEIGDILPVDGIFVEGNELQIDESSITGESDLITKNQIDKNQKSQNINPFLISGSKIMDGQGKMLVCAVGVNTQLGKLKEKLEEQQPPTPLQQKLETIAEQIGKVGTGVAILTMSALLINLIIDMIRGIHCIGCVKTLQDILKIFMIGVTIVVVAVPEGLPLAVTIALAFSVNKMKDEKNLVKQLASCEIMGNANNICSDKTGTLTQNLMKVHHMYINDKHYGSQYFEYKYFPKNIIEIFVQSVCVNSTANPQKNQYDNKLTQIGNKTECALLQIVQDFGFDYQIERQREIILKVLPFSSQRKQMITIIKVNENLARVYVKGACEQILEKCSFILLQNGVTQISQNKKEIINNEIIIQYAEKSLRTITLAYKDIPFNQNINQLNENELTQDLILISIAGIKDPLRPEIRDSIKKCKNAGIIVRMCTGDNLNTAIAIAQDAGILEDKIIKEKSEISLQKQSKQLGFEVLEGKKFRELVGGLVYENPQGKSIQEKGEPKVRNLDAFKAIAKELRVLARSSPDDKYILVTGLIELGNIVAVTGDGTNDAPALKKANVGFAMGIAGTEVSKDAADIILLDDNFASIVTACKFGRNIYDSIRKFIQFQLTVNIVALFMSFMGAVVLKKSPLNSIQMLWVNIIMDTFASLALSTDPPCDSLLNRKPYGINDKIVTGNMWRNIIGQSIYQIIILSVVLFKFPEWLGIPNSFQMKFYVESQAVHFSIFFQCFVMLQVFNEFNARKLLKQEINIFDKLLNNYIFWVIIGITFFVQIMLVQTGGRYVGVSSISLGQHFVCIFIGCGSLLVGVIIKIIPNHVFERINLLREDEMDVKDMDQSFSSLLRKKSSNRMKTIAI
ncbi:hypothetical protein IMG5_028960 [Ichthyophthirius multifiliis]|uniref:Calcium-transporting ATPase n=1 Tax=Ichthyophthirius multifiliis TaxID=5932 RepID=G0QLD2_ICHMU|nr:hypothetical protein IMG5_028960 [Ichthyophthirius multifiliis]EGR33978.1 hypothetical protein IMG5_028960 [Ichthyophthirius multifiliis]|eukprot:XP_004039282.1 hypothetical protein IMG5_028960 [Ichthyophthirius multifiliis]